MERTEQSVQFEGWLKVHMRKNDIESYKELAKIFGVTRQTLYAWIKEPSKLKKVYACRDNVYTERAK